ncbi:MAG: methyltransferase domain-containing protein [Imperialibacter sp.]|uniref:class I SAM-dependent methyltransferase n=1 Tax=Imperialibacter sp. TaxID=2038411 RepID=UPI0032EBB785
MRGYSSTFFQRQSKTSLRSAKAVLPFVFDLLKPKSALDVGCGVGAWLAAAQETGCNSILGIDGEYVLDQNMLINKSEFLSLDISQAFNLNTKYDLVMSLEVGEHLPGKSAEIYVKNLTDHGDAILFSAAIPGQGGTHHINEQWPEYWEKMFLKLNFVPFDIIREVIWNHKEIEICYKQNTILYINQNNKSLIERLAEFKPTKVRSLVHPDLYDIKRHLIEVRNKELKLKNRNIFRKITDRLGVTQRK